MKHRFLAIALAAVVSLGAFSAPVQQFIGTNVTAEAVSAVAAPTANLKGGAYYSKTGYYITLKHSSQSAKIYYSLNGAAYKLYESKLPITRNATLKFYAKVGNQSSKIVSYSYKYYAKANVSVKSGTYDEAKTVKITSPAKNVKIYYTLDGSVPTTKSKLYNAATGIKITESCKLRFIVYKAGWSYKQYSYTYTINEKEDTSFEAEVIRLVNEIRSDYGLAEFDTYDALTSSAAKRADEITDYYSHTRPDGTSCFSVFDEYGIYNRAAGENIAAGYLTPQAVVDGWMNSEGHRANILNPYYRYIGVGYAYKAGGYGHYWVQMFTS